MSSNRSWASGHAACSRHLHNSSRKVWVTANEHKPRGQGLRLDRWSATLLRRSCVGGTVSDHPATRGQALEAPAATAPEALAFPLQGWHPCRLLRSSLRLIYLGVEAEASSVDLALRHAKTFGRRIMRQREQSAATPHKVRGWSFNNLGQGRTTPLLPHRERGCESGTLLWPSLHGNQKDFCRTTPLAKRANMSTLQLQPRAAMLLNRI